MRSKVTLSSAHLFASVVSAAWRVEVAGRSATTSAQLPGGGVGREWLMMSVPGVIELSPPVIDSSGALRRLWRECFRLCWRPGWSVDGVHVDEEHSP